MATELNQQAGKRRRVPRLGLRKVYYTLAGFDLLAVTISLVVIAVITGIYTRSVDENRAWALRLAEYDELSRMAAQVNAPGNDVFATRDVGRERQRLAEALTAFEAKAEIVRKNLIDDIETDSTTFMHESFESMKASMEEMVRRSEQIFAAIEAGDTEHAGGVMAEMDRAYAGATGALGVLGGHVRAIQQATLEEQQAKAHSVRRFEWLIAGLMVVMIVGVTFYGNRLAAQVKRDAQLTERVIEERTRDLEESHRRLHLAERLASIGTLAAGLGHDMKNVLFPVMCRLDVLEERSTSAAAREETGAIRDSIRYLQKLSEGLRLLALDPDDPRLTDATTSIRDWGTDIEPVLRTCLPRDAKLECDLSTCDTSVAVPPHRLTQAVFNLVLNAGEAIGRRGCVRVTAEANEATGTVIVRVADDGHGMSEGVRRRALDPFFTTKARSLSTGLGLALVHAVTQAAGGSVEILSEPGHGTVIELTLPAASSERVRPNEEMTATLSLSDVRLGAFLRQVLNARRIDVRDSTDGAVGDSSLWVCEADRATPEAVRGFLAGDRTRTAVVVGARDGRWSDTGAHVLTPDCGAEQLRATIVKAVERSRSHATDDHTSA